MMRWRISGGRAMRVMVGMLVAVIVVVVLWAGMGWTELDLWVVSVCAG